MRWLHFNPNDPAEASEHQRLLDAVDAWWRTFAEHADQIDRMFSLGEEFALVDFMHASLNAVDPRIMWEYGPAIGKEGHRLVITSESARGLRPMVNDIVARAPHLPRWEFYAYRLAESVEDAIAAVRGRVHAELAGTQVTAAIGEHHHINLTYYHPDTTDGDDRSARSVAFVASETLLSEDAIDHWMGCIDVSPLPKRSLLGRLRGQKPPLSLLPLDRLKPTVEALIDSIRNQLPDQPLHEFDEPGCIVPLSAPDRQWCTIEIKQPERYDYPRRTDLFVAVTGLDRLWDAAQFDPTFDSRRFSRHGETFCYLKIDGRDGLDEEHFADRGEIEDAINAALRPQQLGCTFGGGTGRHYSYIDLALADVPRAIDPILAVLQGGNIHRRSWLLFFDADLCDEWVGIYDDTPPPPADVDQADDSVE